MREYSRSPGAEAWLFPGRLPEDCFLPPECRRENRDLRIPKRLGDMPAWGIRFPN